MQYEWDAAKARRIYLIKFAAIWFAAIAAVGVTVAAAMKLGLLSNLLRYVS